MDIITHGLFAHTLSRNKAKKYKYGLLFVLIGSLISDIGEIIIQKELSAKYGAGFVVYDERTSDALIAADYKVTFLYDLLHSIVLPAFLFGISFIIGKKTAILRCIAFGMLTHIFLDSFTHGKIWALKLFFPISNHRFKILENTVGNWWDWMPKIDLGVFELPIFCVGIWCGLIFWNIIWIGSKKEIGIK